MTTTLPPPPTAPPAPPAAQPPTPPAAAPAATRPRRSVPGLHLLLAELGLAALTVAAVYGFGRIFEDWSFLAPLVVMALGAHATVAVCRRRGIGLPLTFVLLAVEWVLLTTWLFFVETTFALFPTPDTLTAARLELDRSWSAFHQIVAPAPVQTGFLLAASLAVVGGAFLADWAAFRLWSAREALVPSVTLFVFATLLADDRHRTASAVFMVGAALAFVLAHRVITLERSEGWVTEGRARAGRSLLLAGAILAGGSVLVGAIVAPHLPGAGEDAIVDWRNDGDGSNARILDSPLVDIKGRLVDTSNTPLFSVEADTPSYWRLAALEAFDGSVWKMSATTDTIARGNLGGGPLESADDATTFQRFTMDRLETDFLPAAYEAAEFRSFSDDTVRFDRETSTLIADDTTSEGTSYGVTSTIPDFTPDELRDPGGQRTQDVQAATELPGNFSDTARALALEVTDGATTDFDKALALQDWFRESGGFVYSTDIAGGQSEDAIETFLEDRIGYCEQFAGTFAAMARSLDIPARVAVGYTWGDPDPSDPNTYQVVGRNAHAWPEVWLGRYGWVPFEPTPSRGNPSALSYTGISPSQESESAGTEATTTTTTAPEAGATTTTAPAGAQDETAAAPASSSRGSDLAQRGLQVVLLVVAAAVLYLVAVPGSLALRRRRRRARAHGSPAAEVGVAWTEATEALAGAGVRPRPDETHGELAGRASQVVPPVGEPMARLAATADAAAYGPAATTADSASADEAATEIREIVDARLGATGRLRRLLDPRPLWQGRGRRHRTG